MKKHFIILVVGFAAVSALVAVYFFFRNFIPFDRVFLLDHEFSRLPVESRDLFKKCLAPKNISRLQSNQCAKEWFRDRAGSQNLSQALAATHALLASGKMLGERCHAFEHVSAEIAVESSGGDVASVLAACNFTLGCAGGCYHGAMSAVLQQWGISEETFSRFGALCAQDKSSSYECFHGLGHGLADVFSTDIVRALSSCEKASQDSKGLDACFAGVFMQGTRPDIITGEFPPNFHPDDPFFPCSTLPEKYQKGCYEDAGQRYVAARAGEVGNVAEVCVSVPKEEAKSGCRSGAYNAIARRPLSADRRRAYCVSFEQHAEECFVSVARELVRTPLYSREYLLDFCAGLPEPEGNACRKNAGL